MMTAQQKEPFNKGGVFLKNSSTGCVL